MSDLREAILEKMKEPTLACLATITEDGKPWVRYVTPYADENLDLWCSTFAGSRKVGQINGNSEVHITLGVTDPENVGSYLQIQGNAQVLSDPESKEKVWGDHLKPIFSGPDDPNMCVLKITPYRIELQEPKPVPPQVWAP